MATEVHMRSVSEIVNAIKAVITPLTLPAGMWGSQALNLLPLFDRVELFDASDLVEAFRYVLISEQKVCVIVPLEERFTSTIDKRKLVTTRVLPVIILASDRVLGSRQAAVYGNDDTPGAYNLEHLLRGPLHGVLLPNPAGVLVEFDVSTPLAFKDTEKELPARSCVSLTLHCKGGYLQSDLPPGPIF